MKVYISLAFTFLALFNLNGQDNCELSNGFYQIIYDRKFHYDNFIFEIRSDSLYYHDQKLKGVMYKNDDGFTIKPIVEPKTIVDKNSSKAILNNIYPLINRSYQPQMEMFILNDCNEKKMRFWSGPNLHVTSAKGKIIKLNK